MVPLPQYEIFRWRDLQLRVIEEAEKQAEEAEQEGQVDSSATTARATRRRPGLLGRLLGRGKRRAAVKPAPLPPNVYNHGFVANLWEVLLPDLYLERARRRVATPAARAQVAGNGRGERKANKQQ